MREKLIELIREIDGRIVIADGMSFEEKKECCYRQMADHLIANGVTLDNQVASSIKQVASSKWIPVTERLPEKYGKYLCRYVFNESAEYPHFEVISFYAHLEKPRFQGEGACGMHVTHWMPLPPAPKGEHDENNL